MKRTWILSLVITSLAVANAAFAAPDGRGQAERHARPMHAQVIDNAQTMDINNIRMFITNTGSFAWDKTTGAAGLEFPKGTGKTAVFAAGLWVGGICRDSAGVSVIDSLDVAVSEYSDEYGPGAIVAGVPDDPNKAEYKVYKLDRTYIDPAVRDAALADYNAGAVPHGAPVITVQTDGSLDILGDQMCWAVYNDMDPANHSNTAGLTAGLGLEVQQTTFAFQRQGALGNSIFIKYKIINKGVKKLRNMYVSQWSDPDLGGATDDVEGCDIGRSVGFIYNSTNNDSQYGSNVPCVGYDFFQGPTVGGTPLPMASMNVYPNGGGPRSADQTYNYMQGLDGSGNVVTNPVTGLPTTFLFSGDPVSGSGWLDPTPSDHRLMLSTGPFSMDPGETQDVVAGIVIGQSANRLASVALMKFFDDLAQSAFDQNFILPNPPLSPVVKATAQDGAVQLTWDNLPENYNGAPYAFEGYVVYQGASIAGPFTRVATYDAINGIQTVLDDAFDERSFVVLKSVSALGSDAGIRYDIHLTSDAVRGGPLFTGTTYYYVVTAYSVGIGQSPQVLESSFAGHVISVVPQGPAAGVDWAAAGFTSPPTLGRYDTTKPGTTDQITVTVIDPDRVIDAAYKLGYKPDATGALVWYIVRTVGAAVDTILNNQTNYSNDNAYQIFDGLQVKVSGVPPGQLLRVDYVDVGPNPPSYVGFGADLGLPFFNGSADYAFNMGGILAGLGSKLDPSDPTQFSTVELRLTGGAAGQKAYMYRQSATAPRTYPYTSYVDVPFTAWDTQGNRQLNVGLFEWDAAAPNSAWDPDVLPDPFARREWLYIFQSNYSGATPDVFYTTTFPNARTNAADLDFMYVLWCAQAVDALSAPIPADPGDIVRFQTSLRSTNDFLSFSTRAPDRMNVSLAKAELDLVKAVPNPYFAHSSYELNQFIRVLKFTHLPAQCTIRLFNLAGELVRTIDKNDATSEATWDLLTTLGLPIGSGIYVFHVDAPGVGTKVGKVIVFMEKERLNNF